MIRKYLQQVVGQTSLKRELEFYLQGYEKTKFFPPSILSASRGSGKGLVAKAIAAELAEINKKVFGVQKGKMFLTINGAELTDSEVLFEKVMPILAQESEIVLFVDETENISLKAQSVFLSLLTPDDKYQSHYYLNDGTRYDIDHQKFTFLGAASSFARIHPDLIDRLKRFSFSEYDENDLAQILVNKLPDVQFENEALTNLVSTLRSSPRHAVSRANDIKSMGVKRFGAAEWKKIRYMLSIYPYGLNRDEIALLKVLSRGNATLTELSAKLNRTKAAVMDEIEVFLKSKDLISIKGTRGRVLTAKGMKALQEIEELD